MLTDGATADEAAGAQAAAGLWNAAAAAQLAVTSGDPAAPSSTPRVPVSFQPAAAPSHGYFDPVAGDVLINDDLSGHALAVTIAHEVGHAFGLVHVSDRASVMNPGNLDVEPNAGDVAALTALWGRCGVTGAEP